MENYRNRRGGVITATANKITIAEPLAVIEVTEEQVSACEKFALERVGASEALYRARGEERTAKMVEDIINGSVAEFAVQAYLLSKGYECTAPDLSIHAQKSFSADLMSGSNYINVKAQTSASAMRYSSSWIFQQEDKTLTLPSEKGYAFFCIVDGSKVAIMAAVYLIDILEAEAISRPKVGKYAMFKSAIYLSDLVAKNINIRRF